MGQPTKVCWEGLCCSEKLILKKVEFESPHTMHRRCNTIRRTAANLIARKCTRDGLKQPELLHSERTTLLGQGIPNYYANGRTNK